MRNEVILKLSNIFEEEVASLLSNLATLPTEEEFVAALIAAAFGIAKTPEGYAAFITATKAALILMDRVGVKRPEGVTVKATNVICALHADEAGVQGPDGVRGLDSISESD